MRDFDQCSKPGLFDCIAFILGAREHVEGADDIEKGAPWDDEGGETTAMSAEDAMEFLGPA